MTSPIRALRRAIIEAASDDAEQASARALTETRETPMARRMRHLLQRMSRTEV